MLTQDQIDHFETFGFLVCRQIFTSEEIDQIRLEAESLYTAIPAQSGRNDDVIWEDNFIEQNQHLLKLIEDDRIYLAMQDLIGEDFIYLGSEGMRGVHREGGPVHHWHADGEWSLDKLEYKRIKIMLYLDSLTKESGALRVDGAIKMPP